MASGRGFPALDKRRGTVYSAAMRDHHYTLHLEWTGNHGGGTTDYRAYGREHILSASGKPAIAGSSDPAFRGDAGAWNPEELLVASISACHQLWYLHLAAVAGINVTAYTDDPVGVMTEGADGGGQFVSVTLHPAVTISDEARRAEADALHDEAHRLCFIARSVNFPVSVESVEP